MCRSADCTVRHLQLLDTIRKADKDRLTGRKTHRQTDRQVERQTDRRGTGQTDKWTDR